MKDELTQGLPVGPRLTEWKLTYTKSFCRFQTVRMKDGLTQGLPGSEGRIRPWHGHTEGSVRWESTRSRTHTATRNGTLETPLDTPVCNWNIRKYHHYVTLPTTGVAVDLTHQDTALAPGHIIVNHTAKIAVVPDLKRREKRNADMYHHQMHWIPPSAVGVDLKDAETIETLGVSFIKYTNTMRSWSSPEKPRGNWNTRMYHHTLSAITRLNALLKMAHPERHDRYFWNMKIFPHRWLDVPATAGHDSDPG